MRIVSRIVLVAILAVLGAAAWLAWFAMRPIPLAGSPIEFDVRPGLGLRGTIGVMTAAGVDVSPSRFTLLARLSGKSTKVKAGSYEVIQGVTPWQLLKKITRGDVMQSEIVFVEGRSFREIRALLNGHADLRHDSRGLSDAEILTRVGATEKHPEGLFFPDTYLFAKQSSDLDVLRRAYRTMQKRLAVAWGERDPSLPYATPYEALIMASIVEKETGLDADRPLVAAVFVNRLRLGMLMQTDPTVIYGLGEKFDGNLRKRDLITDTPYNTYTRAGLPPTPIAMPGLASIEATMRPPRSDVLYFVARGDGSSVFSRTLDEHNRAVAKYQRRGS